MIFYNIFANSYYPPEFITNTAIDNSDDDNSYDSFKVILIAKRDDTYENYDYFSYLCKQIRQAIDESNYKNNTREQLHRVFTEIELPIKQIKDAPSQVEIAKNLGICTSTLNGYIKTLRKLIEFVRSNDFE